MRRILAAAFFCLLIASTAVARDLGTFGAVYDIVEKDALKELEEKAKSVDFSKAVDRNALVKKARNFAPDDVKEMKTIGPARKDRTFLVDMTYTLERDIKDDKGNIVYPAGIYLQPSQLRGLSQDPRHPQRETARAHPLVRGIILRQGCPGHPSSHGRLLQRALQVPQASGILREHQVDRGVQNPGGAFGGPAIGRLHGSDGGADTSQAGGAGEQSGIKRELMEEDRYPLGSSGHL